MPHVPKPQKTSGKSGIDPILDSVVDLEQESSVLLDMPIDGLVYSLTDHSNSELRTLLRAVPSSPDDEVVTRVEIVGADGQHHALMKIDRNLKLRVRGALGDYALAFNSQSVTKVFGNVGHGVAEGMVSGSVRIRGHAGHGAGTAMTGGVLGIYGTAGDRVGGAMRGGGLFVRGNAGNDMGLGAIGGTIVIGGNAGENVGDPLSDVAVYIRGKAASLAEGVTDAKLSKKQEVQLGLLLISAGIRGDASEFRRIVPVAKLEAEKAARSEVVPNWR